MLKINGLVRGFGLVWVALWLSGCDGYAYSASTYEVEGAGIDVDCLHQALAESPPVSELRQSQDGLSFLFNSLEVQLELEDDEVVARVGVRVRSADESGQVLSAAARQVQSLMAAACDDAHSGA